VIAGIIPVLTVESADEADRACRAFLERGLTTVEITFRTEAAGEAIRRAAAIDGLCVGAGTVTSERQLELALRAGARFAVAPGTDSKIVELAQRSGLLFVPGAATPTEIGHARSLGCELVKIFPASLLGGPAYIRAVSPVFPDVKFVPTGGVNETNVDEYLALPSVVACAGTWLKP
jgi:2-dehydro-3-deoxyphosphogluconate aldolase/(4S)-4-hydroxy-2-oxoglutarate aldolase